ncbi:hypothetical protein BDN72DRAFT_846721 [Pluteus cervinus]|uniref:Uncharacterized protein n=1 Tax=Pluteus cervinus TaxID=181527 RepID=A0ACD3AG66_9AGAR|nr:hypothetical protein BDN72DRAFT_846721 [Pluteus cervinus]
MEDFVSGNELKGMVDSLNHEIMQASAVIADLLPPPSRRQNWNVVDDAIDALRKDKVFGTKLRLQLEARDELPDPTFPVQIALQASLARISCAAIYSLHTSSESYLYNIAGGIEQSEKYPVFAKWQAITHAELLRRGAIDPKVWLKQMIHLSCSALAVAGWPEAMQEANRQAWKLDERFGTIVNMCMALNQVVKQKIFSMRIHLICPRYHSSFDSTVMEEEVLGASPSPAGSRILCTTGLGLTYEEVKLDGIGETAIALKAKVATGSMFVDTSTAPPPRSRSRKR